MHIAIEARAALAPGGGIKRYVNNLISQLGTLSPDIKLTVIYDRTCCQSKREQVVTVPRMGPLGHYFWLNTQLPQTLRSLRPDLVHFTKADVPKQKSLPTVVTIYDIIPLLYPASQKPLYRCYWSRALQRAAQQSDRIITISEQSKADIMARFNVNPDKITVTRLGIDYHKFKFHPAANQANPYILYVGTIEPRKNVAALIKAFNRLKNSFPHKLIIAGRHYKGAKRLKQLIANFELDSRVIWRQTVTDSQLVRLYQQATLFVWPSIYEGWGFPPQEAMACGTPVIVSNGGALPEVVGDAGLVVNFSTDDVPLRDRDQQFVNHLYQAMIQLLSSEDWRGDFIRRGQIQAAQYAWPDVAKSTANVYRALLKTSL